MHPDHIAGVVWHPRGNIRNATTLRFSGVMTLDRFAATIQDALTSVGDPADALIPEENAAWWGASSSKARQDWLPITERKSHAP